MPKRALAPRARRLERGQSLVEMSIGFVILIVLLGGLLDLGRVYFIFLALEDGAGEGAIYLAVNPDCRTWQDQDPDGALPQNGPCADPNNAEFRARNAGGDLIDWSTANVEVARPTFYGVGDPVRVTLRYQFPLLTPIIPPIAGVNPLTLSVTATQTIIGE